MKRQGAIGRTLAGLWLGAVLGACGLQPTVPMPTPITPPAPRAQATPKPSASPKPAKTKPGKQPAAKPSTAAKPAPSAPAPLPLYQQAINRYLSFRSYTAEVQSYGKSQGKDIGAKAKLYWQAPKRLRVEILDTNISKGDQTVIVDEGSGSVRAQAPGWWPFPISVARTDSKLQLPGGPRYDEATVGGMLSHFQAAGAQIEAKGDIDFLGHTVSEFHVRNAVLTDRGMTLARIGIDPSTKLLVFCEQQNAEGIAYQLVFTTLTPDVPLAADLFDL